MSLSIYLSMYLSLSISLYAWLLDLHWRYQVVNKTIICKNLIKKMGLVFHYNLLILFYIVPNLCLLFIYIFFKFLRETLRCFYSVLSYFQSSRILQLKSKSTFYYVIAQIFQIKEVGDLIWQFYDTVVKRLCAYKMLVWQGITDKQKVFQSFTFNIYLNYDSSEMDIKVLKRHDIL